MRTAPSPKATMRRSPPSTTALRSSTSRSTRFRTASPGRATPWTSPTPPTSGRELLADDGDDPCPGYAAVTLLCHGATLTDAVALTGLVPIRLTRHAEEGCDFVVKLVPTDDTNVVSPRTVPNPCQRATTTSMTMTTTGTTIEEAPRPPGKRSLLGDIESFAVSETEHIGPYTASIGI